ncbi:hypothetical protein EJB05_12977, partial [Eragrostis curvula]
MYYSHNLQVSLPVSAFCFSATLRVATIIECVLDATVETVQFPQLRQLELEFVNVSGDSLDKMIVGCPVLEFLLLKTIYGFSTIRISSRSLICISFDISAYEHDSKKLIIEDAPLLERLLQLETCRFLHVSLISAPKVETLATTVIQKLCAVSFMAEICSVQELEFEAVPWRRKQHLPASAFRFSATLRVITISDAILLDSAVESLRFPQLRQLGLQHVDASVAAVHSIITGCPKLECLLIKLIGAKANNGDRSIRINSPSLIRIGFACYLYLELIIEDAPSLERLFCLDDMRYSHVWGFTNSDVFYLFLKILRASFTVTVCSVKFIAINTDKFNLEAVINLTRCFPCLEELSIQISQSEGKNLWRHKHHDLMSCLDIRLKVLVLKNYQGIKSQAHFATFFIVNAKMLKTMRFEGGPYRDYNKFVAKQHQRLQLGKRASKSAQFHFVECACHKYLAQIEHVTDLSKADPYHCIR